MEEQTNNPLTKAIATGEINELIARNARVAYEQGVSRERERIIQLILKTDNQENKK